MKKRKQKTNEIFIGSYQLRNGFDGIRNGNSGVRNIASNNVVNNNKAYVKRLSLRDISKDVRKMN